MDELAIHAFIPPKCRVCCLIQVTGTRDLTRPSRGFPSGWRRTALQGWVIAETRTSRGRDCKAAPGPNCLPSHGAEVWRPYYLPCC